MKATVSKIRLFNWSLARVLRLLLAILFMAEAIFGEFYLLIPISLWLGYDAFRNSGCGGNQC